MEPVTTTATQEVAAAAEDSTLIGGKPSEAVAEAAQAVTEAEEKTLLGDKEGEEGKKVDGVAPPAKVVPEKYEFKLPEGVTLDQAGVDKFTPIFKDIGLSQQDAQKLINVAAPYIQQQVEASKEASLKVFKDMVSEWGEQSKKELGPDYQKKLASVSKVMDKAGVQGFRELMNETGLGNNPTMIKFMLWVGEQFSQDHLADSGKKISNDPNAVAKRMFPTMTQ